MINSVRAVVLSLLTIVVLFFIAVMTLGMYGFLFVIIAPLFLGFAATAFLAIGRRETFVMCAIVTGVAGAIAFGACIAMHLPDGIWFIPGAEVGALPAFVVFHRIRT
ncbi:MAG TPA: hypothetical protein VII75_13015 [Thermoanaerobaculia bacterium]|nr:hypothetical protein [Thermoanaerobaculia bacterium]